MLCEKCSTFIGGSKDLQREHEKTIRFIAEMYSTAEILTLLGVSYTSLLDAKTVYENTLKEKLQALFNSNLVDRYDSIPFKLNDCIEFLDLPYKSSISFKRVLANNVMPADHIIQVIDFIEKDYRPKKAH